jgi:hypothetical protein
LPDQHPITIKTLGVPNYRITVCLSLGVHYSLEDVKKSIWPKSKLMQNVCRRPSDRLLGILARLFLEPKFPHTNFSISSHLPVPGFGMPNAVENYPR